MLKNVAIIWWAFGVGIFTAVLLNGGSGAWVGVTLCTILLFLSILDNLPNWGKSDDPNDWSV